MCLILSWVLAAFLENFVERLDEAADFFRPGVVHERQAQMCIGLNTSADDAQQLDVTCFCSTSEQFALN